MDGNLESWLLSKQRGDIFWITGRPGSGKSTTMKFLLENPKTTHLLAQTGEPNEPIMPATGQRGWCLVGLFITNRGAEQQRQWEPMLFGLLYQLLQARPALIQRVMPMVEKIRWKDAQAGSAGRDGHHDDGESVIYNWTRSNVEEVLLHCTTQANYPIKALVVIDGLDELETQEDARQAVSFLKNLAFQPATSLHTFKVCFASRSEKLFMNLLKDGKRVEMHENTQDDIRLHVWDRLCLNPRFRGQDDRAIKRELQPLMDLVCKHAHGVFLWAASVASLADARLSDYDTMDEVKKAVAELPTEMSDLYRHMLGRIDPRLRNKAYFMLEIVLRARQPPTLLELFLAVQVAESNLSGRPTPWEHNLPGANDLLDPSRLQSQLLVSCKCFLEVVQHASLNRMSLIDWDSGLERVDSYSGSVHQSSYRESEAGLELADLRPSTFERTLHTQYRDYDDRPTLDPARAVVQLLHRTAKDFLLDKNALDKRVLDELFTSPRAAGGVSCEKPPGNGHVYILQFIRAFQLLPANVCVQLRVSPDIMREVRYHAPKVEGTLDVAEVKDYFPLLDDIDRQVLDPTWANHMRNGVREVSWGVTFPAFAVSAGMVGYITYLIAKADNDDDLDHFLNGKSGRPLLHFAAYEANQPPRPAMADLLLRSGANINLRFDGKTAIESLSFDEFSEPLYEMYSVLLKHGAEANSRHFFDGVSLSPWYPLLHLAAHCPNASRNVPRRAIELMRLLIRKGADPNKVDSRGSAFTEALYYNDSPLPQVEWEWLLRKGAKITIGIINETKSAWGGKGFSNRFFVGLCARSLPGQRQRQGPRAFAILNHRDFRRREWYEEDAAEEAERLRPGWFRRGAIMRAGTMEAMLSTGRVRSNQGLDLT